VLAGWYQQGVDVQPRLAWLSTYLRHRDPVSSYWYLSAAPELLAHGARLIDDTPALTPSQWSPRT
jgi:hypothetical protein